MKVLLISPWTKTLYGDDKAVPGHPHVGLAYLTAVLKAKNHQVKIFDQALTGDDRLLFNLLKTYSPEIVGITAFSYCYKYVARLIKEIKLNSKLPVIVGGPHVSAVRKRILEKTPADYAMFGESEESFPQFLLEFSKAKPRYNKVPNLIWRKNDQIIENSPLPLIKDLDNLPLPDYDEFDFPRYSYHKTRTIPIITSRGCPYGCNYCSVRLSMGRGFRARSAENVIDEIRHWYDQGFRNFEINDDCFSLDLSRAKKICDLLIQKKLQITYQLYNGIRVDRVDKELLQKMKESGCVFISYGCESGNQKVLDTIGKGIKLKQVQKAVHLTNKAGIKNSVNFIVGHPSETYKTALESLKFAASLPTNFVNVYNVIPYPGTELFNWIENYGKWIYHPDYIMENIGSRDLKPVFETEEYTAPQRAEILEKGFALYEKSVLRFRFGPTLGFLVYLSTRNRRIFHSLLKLFLSHPLGFKIYSSLTSGSRQ